jgi:hypothetical protein
MNLALITTYYGLGWPDLSMRGDKFDLNWRDVHDLTSKDAP